MPRVRKTIKYRNKEKKYVGKSITWERMKELEYFCARYDEYLANYQACHAVRTAELDETPHGKKVVGKPTENNGLKALYWLSKMEAIEQCAMKAAPDIYQDLLFALRHHGTGYNYLSSFRGMNRSKEYYYRRRDDFFVILDDFLKN